MIASVPTTFQCLRYQGKEKKVGVLLMLIRCSLFYMHVLVREKFPSLVRRRGSYVHMYSGIGPTTTKTPTTVEVTDVAAICNDNVNDFISFNCSVYLSGYTVLK